MNIHKFNKEPYFHKRSLFDFFFFQEKCLFKQCMQWKQSPYFQQSNPLFFAENPSQSLKIYFEQARTLHFRRKYSKSLDGFGGNGDAAAAGGRGGEGSRRREDEKRGFLRRPRTRRRSEEALALYGEHRPDDSRLQRAFRRRGRQGLVQDSRRRGDGGRGRGQAAVRQNGHGPPPRQEPLPRSGGGVSADGGGEGRALG